MNLELNLVGNDYQTFNTVFELKARKRVVADNDAQIMSAIVAFLAENIGLIDMATSDKNFVSQIQSLQTLSVTELQSIKFAMSTFGLDLLAYEVAEEEINPVDVEPNTYEYNIIDLTYPTHTFLHRSTKVVVNSDSSRIGEVYSKIQEIYGFFESDLTSNYGKELMNRLQIIDENEKLIGSVNSNLTMAVNSLYEYMGKEIIVIVPTKE